MTGPDERQAGDAYGWDVARAIVLGLMLKIAVTLNNPGITRIPLINLIGVTWVESLIGLGIFAATTWWALVKSRNIHFLFLMCFVLYSWCMTYSRTGAFQIHVAFLCLFICLGGKFIERKSLAAYFCFSVFASAASFKLNPYFLQGAEFRPSGDFMSFFFAFIDRPEFTHLPVWRQTLPTLTVAGEFLICVLCLLNFRLAIHLVLMAALALSLVQPPVAYVYFCFLPFLLLADPTLSDQWPERFKELLRSPLFWIFAILASDRVMNVARYPYDLAAICLVLMAWHASNLPRIWRESRLTLPSLRPRFLILPAAVALSAGAKLAGGPTPLGYSMFAGLRLRAPMYRMELNSEKQCRYLKNLYGFDTATEMDLHWRDDNNCEFSYFTESGMNFVKKRFCRDFPRARWRETDKGEQTKVTSC